jgi:hypothetical protein
VKKSPGRKEINQWLDEWVIRYRGLGDPFSVSPEHLFLLMGSNLGWDWDHEDVGKAPHPITGEQSTLQGLYQFLAKTMAERQERD